MAKKMRAASRGGSARAGGNATDEGNGGETHQVASKSGVVLTTNQGVPISDNQNSLKSGARGPTLLEDFVLREKITHFDHERIPERIVHARGSGAHGYFQPTKSLARLTKAAFLQDPKKKTEVFARFSTVAGGAGSGDLPRDVRGFAVKFYTDEGNFDLVGNNIPVFFIQDAIKFPDLIHSVKMEPDRGYPQAASAHDTFWDFASLMPESMHMLTWVMSDRAIPRSLRMIEGFGIHTFRLINAKGESTFVKFHWRPMLGAASVRLGRGGEDQRRRPGLPPPRPVRGDREGRFPGMGVLHPGVRPEDRRRLRLRRARSDQAHPRGDRAARGRSARWCSTATPTTSSPRPSRSAFHPGHVPPGIDFTNDPLLQGRLFSYTDTQLLRLGGPNFHELPINRPRCPMHNFQRDGIQRQSVPTGRVAYEPNSLDPAGPRESPDRGFRTFAAQNSEDEQGDKLRIRPESFADHYSQARMLLPLAGRAGAAPHRQRVRVRAGQGRDRADPHAHARPSDDHRRSARRRRRAGARHGRHGRRDHAGARPDRHGAVADAQHDQEGRAHPEGPQGRRAGDRRRRRRGARCAAQGGREGRRGARDRRAEDRRRDDRKGQEAAGRSGAVGRAVGVVRRGRGAAVGGRRARCWRKEAAAIDWLRDAFGHLKAIGYVETAAPMFAKAGDRA